MKYEFKIVLYNIFISVGVNIMLRPFWFNDNEANTQLAIFSSVFTVFLLPVLLIVINYFLSKKHKVKNFIFSAIIIVVCVWISSYMHFINWADSVGSRNFPDGETKAIASLEKIVGSVFAIILSFVVHFKLREVEE